MNSIPMDDIFLHIYILIDDWYLKHATEFRKGQPGRNPEFSDSEMMTVMVTMDYIPFPSERQFVEFVRANYLAFFPNLLEQSQFNRRARQVSHLLEGFCQSCLIELGVTLVMEGLLDTKPVPVIGYRRRLWLLCQSQAVLLRLQVGGNLHLVGYHNCLRSGASQHG